MTYIELYTLLQSLQIPVAYDHFNSKVETPYIVYTFNGLDTFKADDSIYFKENRYAIYLVTDTKDTNLEDSIESLFESNNIIYDKNESYIDSERTYQIVYTI